MIPMALESTTSEVRGPRSMVPHGLTLRALMTLSKGANSLGLQVQSDVARVNFPHEGTRGLISYSWGTVEKAPLVLLQATCKTISSSCVRNSTEWLSSTRCKCN
jgi:hypothetical protein